jgi:hypothetical protein
MPSDRELIEALAALDPDVAGFLAAVAAENRVLVAELVEPPPIATAGPCSGLAATG